MLINKPPAVRSFYCEIAKSFLFLNELSIYKHVFPQNNVVNVQEKKIKQNTNK